jgi:hypothetical protein
MPFRTINCRVVNLPLVFLETTAADDPAEESDSRLIRCVKCGNFCAAVATDDGELVPVSRRRGDQCPTCDGDEFEQVVLTSEHN